MNHPKEKATIKGLNSRSEVDIYRSRGMFLMDHDCQCWMDAKEFCQGFSTSPLRDKLESPPVVPVRLLKLYIQGGFGLYYYVTFRVRGENGLTTDYNAKLWLKPANKNMELLSLDKLAEKETTGIYVPDDNDEGGTKLISGENCSKLCTTAFFLFLKQFRKDRPNLKYAKAKKAAASTWRRLSEAEKMNFISEAVQNQKKKKKDSENQKKMNVSIASNL